MSKNRRLKFIVILLLILFLGILLSVAAKASSEKSAAKEMRKELKSAENVQWKKWKEAHTVKVEVTRVYNYEKNGKLEITEIYSGDEIKSKFKDDKLISSLTFLIPEEKKLPLMRKAGA